jgi:hypothetical protein
VYIKLPPFIVAARAGDAATPRRSKYCLPGGAEYQSGREQLDGAPARHPIRARAARSRCGFQHCRRGRHDTAHHGCGTRRRADQNALSAAVGGVPDIDRFTVGHCQTEAVRMLVTAAPDLRLHSTGGAMALGIARIDGCREVVNMVRVKN